ncbi:MAG: LysR family transcriptional regulator [Pseudomonadota bacterium]
MVTIRQMRSVAAVVEEGSFTRAAQRENATQSGVSQHVAAVESALGVSLFDRSAEGVRPTPAGQRYYARCIEVLRNLELASSEAQATGRGVSGRVRAGLMPAFTRAILPPVLDRFLATYADVEVEVIEGYSGTLTDMVRAQELDFAAVPSAKATVGLTVTHLIRNAEHLVSGPAMGLTHNAPQRLSDLPPLNMIVPARSNARRAKLDEYFETHGVRIAKRLEMDAMLATLGLVARSTWVTVLPQMICLADAEGTARRISPIISPTFASDFTIIEPARRPLAVPAQLFLDGLREELNRNTAFATPT